MKVVNDIERKMVTILEAEKEPHLDDFGSIGELLQATDVLGRSPLLPEFIRLLLGASANPHELPENNEFIEKTVPLCLGGSALIEIVDLIDRAQCRPEKLFRIYLDKFSNPENAIPVRSASLDGALRITVREPHRRFELIGRLLRITKHDDSQLVRNTARIIGFVHAHWPEAEFVQKLVELSENQDALDQVAYELGLCKLHSAMNADNRETAAQKFYASKHWFEMSVSADGTRHDSSIYLLCISNLLNFHRGENIDASKLSEDLRQQLVFQKTWNRSAVTPPWLIDASTQLLFWEAFADKLANLAEELLRPAWYEPAVVVEQYLSALWSVSRSLLARNQDSAVELLVRPRIEGSIGANASNCFLLKEWLRRNTQHENFDVISDIGKRIDEIAAKDSRDQQIVDDDAAVQTLCCSLANSNLSDRKAISQVIEDTHSLSLENITENELALIVDCISFVRQHPDYQKHVYRRLFNAILLWTVRFLSSRLEMTKKDEPSIEYLFKQEGGKKPTEDKLQADYKNVMLSNVGGTEIEVPNVASGRADVLFRLRTERIVTEVKREERDSSFESLVAEYSGQSSDYQNVSGRLGFVLVLDQTTQETGTPHISTLVKVDCLIRPGETDPRLLVFVKVPGERTRPSDLTKAAKQKGAQVRRDAKKAAQPKKRGNPKIS